MRIKVIHKRLGVLHGQVIERRGKQVLVKLDSFREASWVDQRYISEIGACDAVGDTPADHQQHVV